MQISKVITDFLPLIHNALTVGSVLLYLKDLIVEVILKGFYIF